MSSRRATPPSQVSPAPVPPLAPAEDALMRAIARMMTVLPKLLDADLVREQQLSLSAYLVLMNLSEADERRLRMSELAAVCDVSLSGLTRIVDKLEASGFVERQRDADDARVVRAHLRKQGLLRLQQAWPVNLASVRRHIFDHLVGIDLDQLTRVFTAMTDTEGTRRDRQRPDAVHLPAHTP